jgi:transposase-like protein
MPPTVPKLAAWREENLSQGFTVFAFPREHQRRRRTSNPLECVNRELKRRTRVAGRFPNEASLLRLVSALLAETSEEWETGGYLPQPGNHHPALSLDAQRIYRIKLAPPYC